MSDNRYYRNEQTHIYPDFQPGDCYAPLESDSLIKVIDDRTFVCMLCNRKENIFSDETIILHKRVHVHQDRYDLLKHELLNEIPSSNSIQMKSVGAYLNRLLQQNALQEKSYEERDLIIEQFRFLLESIDNESSFKIYGSHLTRTSLIHSNINLEICHPNSKLFRKDPRDKDSIHHKLIENDAEIGKQYNHHTIEYDLISNPIETLNKIYKILTQSQYHYSFFQIYGDHPEKDMNKKVPKLTLRHVETGTILELSCYNESSYKLSELLKIYICLDERVRQLSCLVKYWANICSIDKPDRGTYPPETYIIMMIYYLQRMSSPILPCIHEMFPHLCPPSSNKQDINKSPRTEDVDQSLTNGLKNIDLSHEPEDDSNAEDKVNLNSETATRSRGRIDKQNEPVEEDLDEEDEEDDHYPFLHCGIDEIRELIENWVPQNKDKTISTLFVGFMKFMKDELVNSKFVISIRSRRQLRRSNNVQNSKISFVEDPIRPTQNISRCIGTMRQYDYIIDCFERAFYYLTSIPLKSNLINENYNRRNPEEFIDLFYNETRLESYFSMKWYSNGILTIPSSRSDIVKEMLNQRLFAKDVYKINSLFDRARTQINVLDELPRSIANAYQKRFFIPANSHNLTKFCWLCKDHGHIREECKNIKIMTLHQELHEYDTSLDTYADFDEMFFEMYREHSISPEVSLDHDRITDILSRIIQQGLPMYRFELNRFGSTVNNLGCIDSDIDICLTLIGNETGMGVDCSNILKKVSEILAKCPKIRELEPVLSARVPIIRFKLDKYDIDLSMYNHCALYNSELLRTYSKIDERVPVLAYLVKKIAKVCCIADASRGSLSSYAWSLLVIHFLQKTNPPVLPVLQEPGPSDTPETSMFGVQGWNVWFRKDVDNFPQECRLSVTELFKGFFLYFSCFPWDAFVVSIRTSGLIPRFKKSWNHSMIAIEDPFELTYNLASRLDDSMSIYIINTLTNAYRHIVRTQLNFKDATSRNSRLNLQAILFSNIRAINKINPPYRGCRFCRRIGHKFKDCPVKNKKVHSNNTTNPNDNFNSNKQTTSRKMGHNGS